MILCVVNNKSYVGSAGNIEKRWGRHRECLRGGRHYNKHLQRSWTKYGEESFTFTIVEIVPENASLFEREQWHLDTGTHKFNKTKIAGGGVLRGQKHTNKTRKKMVAGQHRYWKRRRARGGEKLTDEHKSKIAAGQRGKKHGDEAKRKMSEAAKKRPPNVPTAAGRERLRQRFKGIPLSDEHRKKLSESHKGYVMPAEQKAKISEALRKAHAEGRGGWTRRKRRHGKQLSFGFEDRPTDLVSVTAEAMAHAAGLEE